MAELDRIAVEGGLEIRQMMELAGASMVTLFRQLAIDADGSVVVVCGVGNKGGDGLAAARHLVNSGWSVEVWLMAEQISPDAQHQLDLLKNMDLVVRLFDEQAVTKIFGEIDVIIDALIGYNLDGAPRDQFAVAIEAMNVSGKQIISYDLPSGLDATSGECLKPCVTANVTLSLALPKQAFKTADGKRVSGQIWLADLGIPSHMYDEINKGARPKFAGPGELLKVAAS